MVSGGLSQRTASIRHDYRPPLAQDPTKPQRKEKPLDNQGLFLSLAGVDGNRTHQGGDASPIGFEDRARHQTTNYSRILKPYDVASSFQSVDQFQHVGNPADGQGFFDVEKFQAQATRSNVDASVCQFGQGLDHV